MYVIIGPCIMPCPSLMRDNIACVYQLGVETKKPRLASRNESGKAEKNVGREEGSEVKDSLHDRKWNFRFNLLSFLENLLFPCLCNDIFGLRNAQFGPLFLQECERYLL